MISHHEINSMDSPNRILYTTLSLFALAFFSLAPLEAQAQEEPGELYLGLRGGLNQSTFVDGSASSLQKGVGGLFFAYNFNEVFSGELDVFYSTKGADGVTLSGGKDRSDALDYSDDRVTLKYVEVPLLLKLTAPLQQFPVKIRGFAGPSFNFLNAATMNGEEERVRLKAPQQVTERYSFVDVGGIIGGEIAIPLPSPVDEIALDGRYQFGFVNVDLEQDFLLKNRTFSGTLSLRFSL